MMYLRSDCSYSHTLLSARRVREPFVLRADDLPGFRADANHRRYP